jgi:hypothetical protein
MHPCKIFGINALEKVHLEEQEGYGLVTFKMVLLLLYCNYRKWMKVAVSIKVDSEKTEV